jgi:hypothetical protein
MESARLLEGAPSPSAAVTALAAAPKLRAAGRRLDNAPPAPSFNPCDPSQTFVSNGADQAHSSRDNSYTPFIPSPTATPDPSLPRIVTNITAQSVAQMALVGLPLPASANDQALLAASIASAASLFTGLDVTVVVALSSDGASTLATLAATVAVVYVSDPITDLANFTMSVDDTIGLSDAVAAVQLAAEVGQNTLITFATGASVGGQTVPYVSCGNVSASVAASNMYKGLCLGPQAPTFNDSDVHSDAFSSNVTPVGYRLRRLSPGAAPSFMNLLAVTAEEAGAPPVDAASIVVAASAPVTSTSVEAAILPGVAVAGTTPTATAQPSVTPSPSRTPVASPLAPIGGYLGGNLTAYIKRLEARLPDSGTLRLAAVVGAGVGGALLALGLGALGVMARLRWLARRAAQGGKSSARIAPETSAEG